mmetsp:Transcript_45050/g.55145  ORF Transcript_45050/g.55145 Transcript_45050/m.55145 type:complete len:254 (+) Transcript_45050:279-1040(+)
MFLERMSILDRREQASRSAALLVDDEARLRKFIELHKELVVVTCPRHLVEVIAPAIEAKPHHVSFSKVPQTQFLRHTLSSAYLTPVHLHFITFSFKLNFEDISRQRIENPVVKGAPLVPGTQNCFARSSRQSRRTNDLISIFIPQQVEVLLPFSRDDDLHVMSMLIKLHGLQIKEVPATSHLVGANKPTEAGFKGPLCWSVLLLCLWDFLPVNHPKAPLKLQTYSELISRHGDQISINIWKSIWSDGLPSTPR